jgi:hypothetical protein
MHRHHAQEYNQTVRANGWKHWLSTKGMHSPASHEVCRQGLPRFSQEIFIEYLVCFIVADDQVSLKLSLLVSCSYILKSIRVVECPEFRNLCLILRETLSDSDIPRRDKMRETIITHWRESFRVLKSELSVSLRLLIVLHP